jgi:type I restriction enzyme, S subunit
MDIKNVRLGDIATYINGYAFKPEQWDTIGKPIIRIQNLNNDSAEYNYYNGDIDEKYIVNRGDILISWSASIGVYEWKKEESLLNQHIFKVKFDKMDINKGYFKHIVGASLERATQFMHGSTMKHITKKYFDDIVLPMPSLTVQEQIASVLDKAQELIDKRKEQIEALDELVKSKFMEMFGNPLTNSKGFSKIKIKEVIDTSILKAKKVYADDDEISYIDISCIDNSINKIVSYNEYLFNEAPSRAQQCIQEEDILISTVRPNLKNIAMVEENYGNMVATSGVTILRSSKVNKYFLYKYVLSDYFTDEMVSVTSGANYPAIKSSDIYNHEMIYPPIELQNEFADFVKQVDNLKMQMEKSLKELEDNFNSLMQRAFKGELF